MNTLYIYELNMALDRCSHRELGTIESIPNQRHGRIAGSPVHRLSLLVKHVSDMRGTASQQANLATKRPPSRL